MTVDADIKTLRQRREAIVQEHLDAENRHDWDGIFSVLPDWHCEPGPMFHPTTPSLSRCG
jgi:hypothetical protein